MDSIELRKLFCGGLSDQTSDDSLKNYFSQFGSIRQCSVVKDKETGASKRFGFVEFGDRLEADRAVEGAPHEVDGKGIDTKLAVGKAIVDAIKNGALKLFVGGIPKDTNREEVIHFFNTHPINVKVKEFELKTNRETKASRGFGFLTPETPHHLAKLAHVQHFTIREGQKTECVLANENQGPGAQRGGFAGGRGGGRGGTAPRGGGRGGYGSYGGGYEHQAYGNGYGDHGSYGYDPQAYAGYDQSAYAGYDQSYAYGGYNGQQAGYGGYGAPAAYGTQQGRGGARGAGGRGSYHPYSRS